MVPGFNIHDMAWQRVVPVAGDDRGTIQQTAPWYLLVAFVLWMKGPQKRHRCLPHGAKEERLQLFHWSLELGAMAIWAMGPMG